MTPGTECVIRAAAPADAGAIARLAAELARHVRDPDPRLAGAYLEAQLFSAEPWAQCLVAEVRGLVAGYLTYCKQRCLYFFVRTTGTRNGAKCATVADRGACWL